MSTAHVQDFLTQRGWSGTILEFAESSATVELAAEKVGTDPQRIAKTLGFYDPSEPEAAVLVVAAGDAKVNGGMFKRAFGGKPRMLKADDVLPLTGHPIGGVCPFATASGARIFLDESLRRFSSVYPAAGTATSAVEMGLDELEQLSGAEGWVDVAKGWRDEAEEA
ncbi:YbaK/EbsC family protein [Leucobacter chinensis]|uniref:YbaK/EbsC family protein n=1 Tax=Leucobacter chinensis TaxID=2851010 RepID=UPI001C214324